MAEYIELIDKYRIVQSKDTDYNPPSYDWVDNTGEIVRCKDCVYSYDSVGGWCCSHGICVDCIVREDFFCADGVKRVES